MATDSSNKVPNVPPLRFPEFSEEWKNTTISSIATVVGGGTPDTTHKENWDGEILWFTPSEIGKEKYVSVSERRISTFGLKNSGAKLLPKGTILLTSRATIGECSIATHECSTNQGFQSLIANPVVNNEFLFYLIASKRRDLLKRACGSTFLEISANEVRKIKVKTPSTDEQNKIASLLVLIDERISTQSKIIDKLQSLMSGIRAKLLSHTFLGDSIKLSELGKLKNGYAFKSLTYIPNGRYNIITIANVSGDRFIVGEYNRIEILPDDIQEHQILSDDNILISLTGNVGRVSLNRGTNNLLNQRVGLFQLYNNELHEFVYQSISAQAFENSMRLKAQGAAQMNIGKNDVEDYEIPYTANKRLLDMVSSLLQYIDERIILAETLNAQYKYQKLYLLQQMFI